jgi:alanine racemase
MSDPHKQRGYRPTWAVISLGNLRHNYRMVRASLGSAVKMLVTVKADAYGHGLVPVARQLQACGADYFGVASIDEGIRLREAGIKRPILILGLILASDVDPVIEYGLTATVCDLSLCRALDRAARRRKKTARVHVKVDTGMGRIGVSCSEALELVRSSRAFSSVEVEGIFTHFPSADTDRAYTQAQIRVFQALVDDLAAIGIRIPLVHAANSVASVGYARSRFSMVRPGLILYGLYPKKGMAIRLKPVLNLKSRIIFVKKVPAGCGISYGRSYVTKKPTTIITIPIGYGDGYPRNLSGRASVLLHGKRFPVSGRICMDQIMSDVGNEPVRVGEEVVLIGSQGNARVCAEELATLSGTIPYEIVCGLGSRIPRVYTRS